MATYDLVLNNIYQPQNNFLLDAIVKIVSPHSEKIAKKFYYEMLNNENAAVFLRYDEVKNRLTASMIRWIKDAFVYLDSQKQIEEYRYYQQKIGRIYKKVGVPVSLVNYAMYLFFYIFHSNSYKNIVVFQGLKGSLNYIYCQK